MAAQAGALRERMEGRVERKKVLAFDMFAAIMVSSLVLLAGADPTRASSIFTVTNTADPGDGNCNASGCTLREAINEANGTSSKDAIHFNIQGGGVKTIKPKSQLPQITQPVIIDGYTQSGASKNTLAAGTNAVLKIELNGEDAEPYPQQGLKIRASDSVVTGLVINHFGSNGIDVGGFGSYARGNRVVGNFIGTDPSGTLDRGNDGRGVVIYEEGTSANTVGGSRPAGRNLISGNDSGGVGIFLLAADNAVLGNLVGTKKDGTGALGNSGSGVLIDGEASGNIVGGTLPGTANTIAFNSEDGVTVGHEDGFDFGPDTSIGNGILRNSIFSNGGLGIDLVGENDPPNGATNNDEDDPDEGPNNLQNKPDLTSAENSGGETTVKGDLNSAPNETFKVRFFSNPSGNEGKKYIGAKSVTTNANGNTGTFTFKPENKVGVAQNITATATRNSTGDTSEFSGSEEVA
jgi:CSLREA domain-containing protein